MSASSIQLKSSRSNALLVTSLLALSLLSATAYAHPGHDVSSNMFFSGLIHPLTGFDHLFAMLAVGFWSALTHTTVKRALYTPVSFICLLLIGALLGVNGITLPNVEPIIMASLLILGLLVATRIALPTWAGVALVGFFALFHGIAHGFELAPGGNAGVFIAGLMLTTFVLHVAGLAAGFTLKQRTLWLTRIMGVAMAGYSIALFTSVA